MTGPGAGDHAEMAFMRRGVQYYITGRHGCLAQQFPVCANLLHHAVELFTKGILCRTHTIRELHEQNHNLKRTWREFRRQFPDGNLERFDGCVAALHKFERLRYPNEELKKGMVGQFVLMRGELMKQESFGAKPSPTFDLVLEDVDELVSEIFRFAKVNPPFYLSATNPLAKAALDSRNAHRMIE